jgi:GNAT superfamily N-acetyltransferase
MSPQTPYTIKVFPQPTLLSQPFLSELQTAINTSYHSLPNPAPSTKTNTRLKTPTQLPTELTESGFTAIAFLPDNTIIGTASIKPTAHADSIWKVPGHFERFSADEISSGSAAVLDSVGERSSDMDWNCEKGEVEIVAVAVLPGYRGLGIATGLVGVCEGEVKRRLRNESRGNGRIRVHLEVVRDVAGGYWVRRGFEVVGEQYCPPSTWGLEEGFVLWGMVREGVDM